MAKEDQCLTEASKTISMDPITDTNQNNKTYWRRIKTTFDELKLVDPEFAGIQMERTDKAMSNHWMVRMFEMFRRDSNTDAGCKFLHVFTRIESCEKWAEVSIEQCIADAKSHSAMREEKSGARWSALMTKQDAKLDLLRTNVAAKKRNTDLTFVMGGGDTTTMDPQVKAWYFAEGNLILNLMSGPAATASPIATHHQHRRRSRQRLAL
ncbi:methionyl-trna synthetase [Hordeum vulgare]|nr:methionyl-trna synthetase [Hordeum vulgare]